MQPMVYSFSTAVKNENSAHERQTRISFNARGFSLHAFVFQSLFNQNLMLL